MYTDDQLGNGNTSGEQLARRIFAFISRGGDFDALAQEIFRFQFQNNAPYRRFCSGRGVTPERVQTWRDIPPAPAAAFKQFELTAAPLQRCVPELGGRVFHSSGTTGAETSRHFMDRAAVDVYRASLYHGFSRFVLPEGVRLPVFALMPPPIVIAAPSTASETTPQGLPHSSLSFMLAELITEFGGSFFFFPGWQTRLTAQLRIVTEPLVVFGTAFAFIHFFDAVPERFVLPPGSRIVETGGFKGRSREVSRTELYRLFTERFGVPRTHCLSEYGMSEMASQFYDSNLFDFVQQNDRPPRKIGPATVRTRIIDPVTGSDAAPGQEGLLAHYDICNLNSVIAIQTEDMGRFAEDGDGFELLGRAPGAILRGCSLTAEEWQEQSDPS